MAAFVELSHREAMAVHAMRRLWRRASIAISRPEYDAIAVGIRAGLYPQVAINHLGQKVYEVTYRKKTVYAVWRDDQDCICTFLLAQHRVGRGRSGPTLRRQVEELFREARAV